jgi:glutathione reductase (NADPH)
MNINDHDWKTFLERKNVEIQRLNNAYEKTQKDNGVNLIRGYATLKDQHTVVVNNQEYTTKYILLAVGGKHQ